MTEALYLQDAYIQSCEAVVQSLDREQGVVFDRSPFYPMGGGQPGDQGLLILGSGSQLAIKDSRRDPHDAEIYHLIEDPQGQLKPGDRVTLRIDWQRRHRLMRMHSCMHLLCSLIDAGVTGGSVGEQKGRLDFDLPEQTLDKEQLTHELNRLIADDHPVTTDWISDEDLAAQPELVRTMSVKPPMGAGRVRLVNIEGVDLQPCGGTHVATTGEIGRVRVAKIEKKGRSNRRVNIVFDD